MENVPKLWRMRNLAVERKINIIKTLSISKNIQLFIYLLFIYLFKSRMIAKTNKTTFP